MRVWTPLLLTIAISVLVNAFPLFMAFVVGDEGWVQVGWLLYLFSIPVCLLLMLAGLVLSLRRRRRASK